MLPNCLAHTESACNKNVNATETTPIIDIKSHQVIIYGNHTQSELESQAVPNSPPINQCDSNEIKTGSGNVESSKGVCHEKKICEEKTGKSEISPKINSDESKAKKSKKKKKWKWRNLLCC